MEEYYEAEKDFIDSLFMCEEDFIDDLLESGSTWENAKRLLAIQNEQFGKPVVIRETKFENGVVWKCHYWVTEFDPGEEGWAPLWIAVESLLSLSKSK
jgi:hypothetical protein